MSQQFQLVSDYRPTGDQPTAIAGLIKGVADGHRHQTLLGATGTGKSIGYDDPVYVVEVLNGQRIPRVISIGTLIDAALALSPEAVRMDGDTEILDLPPNCYYAQSFDPRTCETNLYPIQSFVRHHAPAMYHLTTDCGRSATMTGDHNLWVLRNGSLALIETADARPDDYLPVPETLLGTGEGLTHIDTLTLLRESSLFVNVTPAMLAYEQQFGTTAAAALMTSAGVNSPYSKLHAMRHNIRNQGFSLTTAARLSQQNADFDTLFNTTEVKVGGKKTENSLPARLSLTREILQFFGYYIAEGTSQHGYIILANRDKDIRAAIEVGLQQLGLPFGIHASSDYQISSTALTQLLGTLCGTTAHEKRLPAFWPQLSNGQLAAMLSAYFDGDGTVDRASAVSATTASPQLASDLCYALLRFGIWARQRRVFKRATNTNHAGDWYITITVSGQENLQKFARRIGFTHAAKSTALEAQLHNRGNSNVDIAPIDGSQLRWLREQLHLSAETLADASSITRSSVQHYEHNRRFPQRSTLKRVLHALMGFYDARGSQNSEWLSIWHSLEQLTQLRWTRVTAVTPVSYDHPYVYDFCVPGVENFLAGSGGFFVHNTYTIANVVQQLQRPTLVLAHNKTLAAQLYAEFKEFFPKNAVEYYVSYYDYYQPESYVPRYDLYIEKQTQINDHIERLRVASKAALLSRPDVLIVASVSCIYGTGDPETWGKYILELRVGDTMRRESILRRLVQLQYTRNDMDLAPGSFRVRGDTLEIHPFYEDAAYRVQMFDDDIERILRFDPLTGELLADQPVVVIFPAAQFMADQEKLKKAISDIEAELEEQLKFFTSQGKLVEAQRLEQRARYDLEMLREVGFTGGIENYSRHMEQRPPGSPPHTLIDYFPDDFLLVIDESHMTMPQIRGMYNGDQARKSVLVDYGFRLPSAMDNRPLKLEEFEARMGYTIYTTATPAIYENTHSTNVVQQIIRPTGILDPLVDVRPVAGQIDDLLQEVAARVKKGQRALVTTFTQRMAEELAGYFNEMGIKSHYLHAEVDTLERVEILRDLRMGVYDAIVGINLLREGIDLPEVSLVGILDADKEGFLRSTSALIQTIGRAARHTEGRVILYANTMTDSMKAAIAETERRRAVQDAYNKERGITPVNIVKQIRDLTDRVKIMAAEDANQPLASLEKPDMSAMAKTELHKLAKELEREMKTASQNLEFEKAAALRDQLFELRGVLALKDNDDLILGADQPQKRASGDGRRGRR